MKIIKLTNESKKYFRKFIKRSPNNYGEYEAAVDTILANVKENGDKALFDYTKNLIKPILMNPMLSLHRLKLTRHIH